MNFRIAIIAALSLGWTASASAQSHDEMQKIYEEAHNEYNIGNIESARNILEEKADKFQGTLRQEAFRLLSLCCIALDEDQQAEAYTHQLLIDNPYYTTTADDPMRFTDLVNKFKNGMTATITTASSQTENLDEAPVPVTLITEEMIRNSGARNLKEALIAFVPGMTSIDNNDDINISMRGLFSTGQEMMLIMLNGQRMNSYATNIQAPDFSISLEKIKQIEVLRGPASSLYGGVALTAVINIITKSGSDIDGIRLKAGGGNYGQWRGDMLLGKRYFDIDFFAWVSYYHADGQGVFVPAEKTGLHLNSGNVYIGRIGNKPNFDIGFTLKYKDLHLQYNNHFSQVASPYTTSYMYSPYSWSKYTTIRGQKPSVSSNAKHAELQYSKNISRKLFVNANLTYDLMDLVHYQVMSDSACSYLGKWLNNEDYNDVLNVPGIYRYMDGQEYTFGAQLKGDYTYIDNANNKGYINFGMHGYRFTFEDMRYIIGCNFSEIIQESTTLAKLSKGHETGIDGFVQLKHKWNDMVVNIGLRYDYKKRYNRDVIREWSPRASLIWLQPKWNVKLSYSKAFVDAPYMYRKTNLVLAGTGENLKSEYLHSLQLTLAAPKLIRNLNVELNSYYNQAENLIYPNGLVYNNALKGKYVGTELMADYRMQKFSAFLTLAWMKVLSSSSFGEKRDEMYNVPAISSNAVLTWKPVRNVSLHTNISFMGRQKSYGIDIKDPTYITTENVPARCILALGGSYTWKNMEIGLDIHNIGGTRYSQGGMNTGLVPQQGRWFMASVAYNLSSRR